MSTLLCKRYHPTMEEEWNKTVSDSRNGTFLINRKYLDYHSDRFSDHSLIFEMDGDIIGLFPANEQETTIYSHQGLTRLFTLGHQSIRASASVLPVNIQG